MFIITAWNERMEQTVRSADPKVIIEKARELAGAGLRLSIVRTSTGEPISVSELEADIKSAQGPPE